jgi:chitinase
MGVCVSKECVDIDFVDDGIETSFVMMNTSNMEDSDLKQQQYEIGAYFTNWSIYARKFTPDMIPVAQLNTIYYAFFKPADDGHINLSDPWADTQIWTDWSDPHANDKIWGCLGKFRQLKQSHHFDLICSVGGWSFSSTFSATAASSTKRTTFADDCKSIIDKYGFDGIDLDWEFPGAPGATQDYSPEDPQNLALLLEDVRKAIGNSKLSICLSVGQDKYSLLDFTQLNALVDSYTVMAYDISGTWSKTASHQSALQDVIGALKDMRDRYGLDLSKVNLGMPVYGRVFDGCTELGQHYDVSKKMKRPGQWEAAIWDYKAFPSNCVFKFDDKAQASYAVVPGECLITYDSIEVLKLKCEQVKQLGLKGVFFWEVSADESSPQSSLVAAASASLNISDKA